MDGAGNLMSVWLKARMKTTKSILNPPALSQVTSVHPS